MRDLTHAYRTLEYLREHPETHNQAEWRCKTGMCFAGWYAELKPDVRWVRSTPDRLDDYDSVKVVGRDDAIQVGDFARVDMGISGDNADDLFFPHNTTDDIAAVLFRLAG